LPPILLAAALRLGGTLGLGRGPGFVERLRFKAAMRSMTLLGSSAVGRFSRGRPLTFASMSSRSASW